MEYLIAFLGFAVLVLLVYVTYLKKRMSYEVDKRVDEREEEIRGDALERSRATLKGKISEHLAPFLDEFGYKASDARFLGSPVDYVIFDGYSDSAEDIKVILADVKTGEGSDLNHDQRKIKEAVEEGLVEWETIRLE
ncbi:MAG: Holliday junction resolvase-like protein [Candidatus Aenigmatarchaeota archaeon]